MSNLPIEYDENSEDIVLKKSKELRYPRISDMAHNSIENRTILSLTPSVSSK